MTKLFPAELKLVVPMPERPLKIRKQNVELTVRRRKHGQFGPHVTKHHIWEPLKAVGMQVFDPAKRNILETEYS